MNSAAENNSTAAGLAKVLGDTYALYLKTHIYHWNVVGVQFHTLHTMFEEQYTEMWQAIDEIAERIRSLGETAPVSGASLAALSSLGEDNDSPSAEQMIRNLIAGHEVLRASLQVALECAERDKDAPSADLATRRLEQSEKTRWMLNALIQ